MVSDREIVVTPLGKGVLVYQLPEGRVLVEFPWGGGELFFREEIQVCPPQMTNLNRIELAA